MMQTAEIYVIVDLEKWAQSLERWKDPETLIKPPARLLRKEDAVIILTPYGFPEHKAVRLLVEVEQINPEDWEDRASGVFYGGTPEDPRANFTGSWKE